MAKTYNRLELDVNKKPNSIGIRPVQNDTKSRYLDVCLYENGVPINLTGEQVRITFRKADGSTFFNQGEVTDATAGRCQFALTNEILSEAKAVESQISVWNASGQILSTQVFEIYVTAAIPWTDAVESENEYGVLVVLFQEIQDALDTMHKIATTFGEPGDKAAEYGVDTFWGILEMLAQRGDVESALQNKIKAYLNSTVGTSGFQSLDKMLEQNKNMVSEHINMVSGYINETGEHYIPSTVTQEVLLNKEIRITEEQSYTWTAKYSGCVMLRFNGCSNGSNYLSKMVILKNEEQTDLISIVNTSSNSENSTKYVYVEKGDIVTIKLQPYTSARPLTMTYLDITYDIVSKSTLNIVRKIQSGTTVLSNTGSVNITISAVDTRRAIALTQGGESFPYIFDSKQLLIYGSNKYRVHWTVVEFY